MPNMPFMSTCAAIPAALITNVSLCPQSGVSPSGAALCVSSLQPGASSLARIPGLPPLSFLASKCASFRIAIAVSKSASNIAA